MGTFSEATKMMLTNDFGHSKKQMKAPELPPMSTGKDRGYYVPFIAETGKKVDKNKAAAKARKALKRNLKKEHMDKLRAGLLFP